MHDFIKLQLNYHRERMQALEAMLSVKPFVDEAQQKSPNRWASIRTCVDFLFFSHGPSQWPQNTPRRCKQWPIDRLHVDNEAPQSSAVPSPTLESLHDPLFLSFALVVVVVCRISDGNPFGAGSFGSKFKDQQSLSQFAAVAPQMQPPQMQPPPPQMQPPPPPLQSSSPPPFSPAPIPGYALYRFLMGESLENSGQLPVPQKNAKYSHLANFVRTACGAGVVR